MKTAFIHNPKSLRNRSDGDVFFSKAKAFFGDYCVRSHHGTQLLDDISFLRKNEISTIAINGGDGTVSSCLTAIAAIYPRDELPNIAVIPSGNTNLIAGDVGYGTRHVPYLEGLVEPEKLSYKKRAPIKLSWPGDETRQPVLGMFGGCAGYARAVRIAHSPTVLKFAPHDFAVFLTILSSVMSLCFKKMRREWLNGDQMSWSTEDEAENGYRGDRSFLFLATGLEKISHKIWPFWDSSHAVKGFHFLNIDCFPQDFSLALFNLLRGRAPAWLREHPDYTSYRTEAMIIKTESDFVLDGEVFTPSADSQLRLEQGPAFRFLHV